MSQVMSVEPTTTHPASTPASGPSVEVFAVYGVEPEIQAYAMAKYSRSALSMKESLREITSQKAEKFLNTFYFQYGHRSIADLAHVALAIERLSILAAIVVADEPRWDGQERSTRYQDFKKSGYYTPAFTGSDSTAGANARALYHDTIEFLFANYEKISQKTFEYLVSITPRPADMKVEAYERTLRARAFDVSRYLLPLATNTSLGEIVNARTLETQVAHLLSQPHREVRELGALLKRAATSPAYNANEESLRSLVDAIRPLSPEVADRAERELLREVRVAPTLVKYADPNAYEIESRRELRQAAAELMCGVAIQPASLVDLLDSEPLEIELATRSSTATVIILTVRFARPSKPLVKRGDAKSLTSACIIAASTTRCRVRFPPAISSASTSSWILAVSATCTGTAAASRSCRISRLHTDTTRRRSWKRRESVMNTPVPCHTPPPPWQSSLRREAKKLARTRNTRYRLPSASGRCSRWISPKPSTFPSCAPHPRATLRIATWPMRCTKP